MQSDFIDPYIDAETGVLRNLVGATTYDELRNAEGELAASRMGELLEAIDCPMKGSLEDFQLIHRRLFGDIYDWAGEIRTVEIRKNADGAEYFLPSTNIPMGMTWAQEELQKDGMLKDMSIETFIKRLAYHYDNYNFIHPFREGNGRTQRLFWSLFCHDAGYDLNWLLVTGAENDEASRLAAEGRDYSALEAMFGKIVVPCHSNEPISKSLLSPIHLKNAHADEG